MLTISCPHCGPRDETEFVNGGEGHSLRPAPPESVAEAAWADYLFFHDNPRGVLNERWCHVYGCGLWFHVSRCTLTHAVSAIYGIAEDPLPPE